MAEDESGGLTHLDARGAARMVDVSAKPVSRREARARARVRMRPETLARILDGSVPKGDVLASARIAGIMAAKRTGDLIPLCHPLPLDAATLDFEPDGERGELEVTACCVTSARTGVEMEAMTAASVAALTIYDMCKALEKGIRIEAVELLSKTGGKSGDWFRDDEVAAPR